MSAYTAKERRAIEAAFANLEALAEGADWSAAPMLREALTLERRECSTIHDAKRLVVESAAEHWEASAGELYTIRPGCRLAAVLGGGLGTRYPERFAGWLERYYPDAKAAGRSSMSRRLDAIDESAR